MKQDELKNILTKHEKWLKNEEEGKRAGLRRAGLRGADLQCANLQDADLDYSCWPLWCGDLDVHIDDRLAVQMLYHLVWNVLYSKNTSQELKKALGTKKLIKLANKMHREDVDRIVLSQKADGKKEG